MTLSRMVRDGWRSVLAYAAGFTGFVPRGGRPYRKDRSPEAGVPFELLVSQAFVQTASDAIIAADSSGTIMLANPAAEQLFGNRREGLIGGPLGTLPLTPACPSTAPSLAAIHQICRRTSHHAFHYRGDDGVDVPVDVALHPIELDGQRLTVLVIGNRSPRKDAEQELREHRRCSSLLKEIAIRANESKCTEEVLRAGLDACCRFAGFPFGHVYLPSGPDGCWQSCGIWNPPEPARIHEFRAATECGVDRLDGGLLGRVLAKRIPAWANERIWESGSARERAAQQVGIQTAFAFPILAGDRVFGVVECFSTNGLPENSELLLVLDPVGRILGKVLDRIRAIDALNRGETFLRKVLEHSPIPLLLETERSPSCFANQAFLDLFGHSRNASHSFDEWRRLLFPDEDYRELVFGQWCDKVRDGGTTEPHRCLTVEATCVDGSHRTLEMSLTSVEDRTLVVLKDVTEQLKSAAAVRKAKDDAVRANRFKSQFIATMSHELRTPLNGIIGMTELLRSTRMDSRQRGFLDACHKNAHALLQLIRNILDISRIEAGRLELEQHEFPVGQLVEDTLDQIAARAFEKSLEIVCRIDPSARITVQGDSGRIRQILLNLLSNAVKFTNTGEITVRVAAEPTAPGTTKLRFRVSDTGIGISESSIDRLFEPFVQVTGTPDRSGTGSGLGLAISKLLAEAMGGSIGVQSERGRGSMFWFEVCVASLDSPTLPEATSSLPCVGKRALVVSPSTGVRRCLQEELDSLGMVVTFALTSAGASRILSEPGGLPPVFDFVFLDESLDTMQMPDRFTGAWTHLVLLLRFDSALLGQDLSERGVSACLTKPVKHRELMEVIRTLNTPLQTGTQGTWNEPGQDVSTAGKTNLSGYQVLLAEDNEVNQLYVRELLSQLGLNCRVAKDGIEAFRAVEQESYQLVLMDCRMPKLNGLEATRRIRALEKRFEGRKRTPIVALTANATGRDREDCLAAGMDDYITKPFSAEQLTDMIQRYLPPQRAASLGLPTEVPDTRPPAVDTSSLIENCLGDLAFAESLLRNFAATGSQRVREILDGIRRQDQSAVAEAAHSLKGAAGIVKAGSVREAAVCVEHSIRDGDLQNARQWASRLRDEMERCAGFVEQELCFPLSSLPDDAGRHA